jgi:ribonuclease BN (tRNA processing enzyme)
MKIRILGAHKIETKNTRYPCLLVDDVLALDAGALTSTLSLAEQQKLKAVLLTHRHYDHVKDLPPLGMNFFVSGKTLEVYAIQSVFKDLAAHYEDEELYPDFTKKPPQKPAFRFNAIETGREVSVRNYKVLPVAVNHSVPCVGYQVTSPPGKRLFYTSDTGPGLAKCWQQVSPDLLIIEVVYADKNQALSVEAGHLTPSLLQAELENFRKIKGYLPRIVTIHTDPLDEKKIKAELAVVADNLNTEIEIACEDMRIEL